MATFSAVDLQLMKNDLKEQHATGSAELGQTNHIRHTPCVYRDFINAKW